MPLKYQYILFIGLLHVVLTILVYNVLKDNKWYFLLSELLIILSLMLSYMIYNSFIRPIEFMKSGVNAIRDEDFNVKFLRTQSNEMNELIDVFNTMLDRLGHEQIRTQEQAYFLEKLIEASPIGMIILGYDGEVTDINISARLFLKISLGTDISSLGEVSHPLAALLGNLETDKSEIITIEGILKYRCHASNVVHRGFNRKFIMIEELSKELLRSEKEAYGKVIRMMAHEVNNSMGAVNSILQSVMDFAFDTDEEGHEYKESLEIAKTRNEGLAKFMKNFADVIRLPEPVLQNTDLVVLVEQCARLMRPLAMDLDIEMSFMHEQKEIYAIMDPNLMQQVIVNILKNAIESIGTEGKVGIKTSNVPPQLVISDNGPGIPDEVQGKLFSPFYSTKPSGQGIGLVLIRDILMGHGAIFSLETNEATGWTEFKISFE